MIYFIIKIGGSMNSIQIDIKSYGNNINIYIDIKNNIIRINNLEKDITNEKIDDLLRIIRRWKKEYHNSKIIDAESFYIKIDTDEGIDIINGKGEYPENYILLKDWISDIYE